MFTFDVWQCPYCKYVVTDTEMQYFRYNYGCPRCFTSFAEFVFKPKVTNPPSAVLSFPSATP